MELGQAIFQRVWGAWRRRRQGAQSASPSALCLADDHARWTHTASLLCGAPVEIKADTGAGGVVGDILLLPRQVDLFHEVDRNADALRYRIAFSASVRTLGKYLPADLGPRVHGRRLATLLAVPAVRAHMEDRFPRTVELREVLGSAARTHRASPAADSLGGILEGLTLRLLGDGEQPFESGTPAARALAELEGMASQAATGQDVAARAAGYCRELVRTLPRGLGSPPAPVMLWGELQARPADAREVEAAPADAGAAPPGSEQNVVELERTLHIRRRQHTAREDRPLYHMFEKLETAEEYDGQSGTPDDSGDVQQMQDAVNELQLGTAIRTTEAPRNLVKAEVLVEGAAPEVAEDASQREHVFRYPEWDAGRGHHREQWCTVVQQRYAMSDGAPAETEAGLREARPSGRQVESIRAHMLRALYRRQTRKRQPWGAEIDVDAVVERQADVVAGHTPSERLYLAERRAPRDVAVLVLLDTSFSTDGWVDGRRVLEVEIEALLMLAAAFEGHLEDEIAVATFHSHTRNDVRFGLLKGFEESWSRLRSRAPALQAQGYTRIGAALRHGTTLLDDARARHKLLLLVSDGKPTDYDRYEGRYGIEDVAQAVREANQRRIRTFGLAVESRAKVHLARMLGPGGYRVLPNTSMLADAMGQVFTSLIAP